MAGQGRGEDEEEEEEEASFYLVPRWCPLPPGDVAAGILFLVAVKAAAYAVKAEAADGEPFCSVLFLWPRAS